MAKEKFYVVWHGVEPGIYTNWKDCEKQVKGFDKALYKSFGTKQEAEEAFYSSPYDYVGSKAMKAAPKMRLFPTFRHIAATRFCHFLSRLHRTPLP